MIRSKMLLISVFSFSSLLHCMNFNPLRRSTKKKHLIRRSSIEIPDKPEVYEPGKKYKEPEYKGLYDFLDVEAFRNELKEIDDQGNLRGRKKSWYHRFITLLSPFDVEEK